MDVQQQEDTVSGAPAVHDAPGLTLPPRSFGLDDCMQVNWSFSRADSIDSDNRILEATSHPRHHWWHRHLLGDSEHPLCHAPLDRKKAWNTGSLSFAPIYAELHNRQRRVRKSFLFGFMSNFLPLVMGIVVAILAWVTGEISSTLSHWRTGLVRRLVREELPVLAWFAHTGLMAIFALLGSLPVIFHCPSSGSSGIPAVIGLLNGCDLRKEFTLASLAARFFGVTAAVSSGLVAGPEGPMIFIGACVGAIFSRIPSSVKVWEILGRPPAGLNADVYLRDYVAIGAGCGIAAAFRAPIAGTLFVVEEAASHFDRKHLAKIFVGGLASLEVIAVTTGGAGLLEYRVTTGPGCQNWAESRYLALLWFASIGITCGFAGALFNSLNIRLMQIRCRYFNASRPHRRVAEIVALCLLTSSIFVVLPQIFTDHPVHLQAILSQSTGCLQTSLRNQLVAGSWIYTGKNGIDLKYVPKPCVYGFQYDRYKCGVSHEISDNPDYNDTVRSYARACNSVVDWAQNATGTLGEPWAYCCNFDDEFALRGGKFYLPENSSCSIDLGEELPTLVDPVNRENDDGERFYNPMASLSMVPWSTVAQNLFLRGVPHILPLNIMIVFFLVFFVLAAVTAGSAIPSGLLLPQLICGALLGRIVTLIATYPLLEGVTAPLGQQGESIWSPTYTPFFKSFGGPLPDDAILTNLSGLADPGIGAVVGAAAFLGGSGRITLFTTVMMVEITGDPLLILPVGVATMIAVLVGRVINEGLYHSLIDVQSFPVLPDVWPKTMPYLQVRHAFPGGLVDTSNRPVITVPLSATVRQVRDALSYTYKAFPVVNQAGTAVGVAERADLRRVQEETLEQGGGDLDYVDVGAVSDPYPMMIRSRLPIKVAFDLFKRMEMRRIVVVDDNHFPLGVLTRRSLLPWVVEARIGSSGGEPFVNRPSGFPTSPRASPRI